MLDLFALFILPSRPLLKPNFLCLADIPSARNQE